MTLGNVPTSIIKIQHLNIKMKETLAKTMAEMPMHRWRQNQREGGNRQNQEKEANDDGGEVRIKVEKVNDEEGAVGIRAEMETKKWKLNQAQGGKTDQRCWRTRRDKVRESN